MFQSHSNFLPLFSITFPCSYLIAYHLVPSGSSPFSIAHFTARTFRAFPCRLTYSIPASFLHFDNRCSTISLYSPQNWHLSSFTNPLIFFHALVSIICSCSANIIIIIVIVVVVVVVVVLVVVIIIIIFPGYHFAAFVLKV